MAKLINEIATVAAKSPEPATAQAAIATKVALHFGALWTHVKSQPDPYGSLRVDRRVAVTLPKIQDTLNASWVRAWSAGLPLKPTSVIDLELKDADLGKKDDPIGTCTWTNLRLGAKTSVVAATNCSHPRLVTALLVVQPAGFVELGRSIKPGRYLLSEVTMEAAHSKANGKKWDATGEGRRPDPRVVVMVDKKKFFTCPKVKDVFDIACSPQKEFTITPRTVVELRATDMDAVFSDLIGTAKVSGLLQRARIGQAVQMTTSGQINKASIRLVPASR